MPAAPAELIRRGLAGAALATLWACAAPKPPPSPAPPPMPAPVAGAWHGQADQHVPLFATLPFEPFTRADAIGIALREWRLFGQKVDDDPPDSHPEPPPEQMPERMPGMWQRVGEYWWEGMDPDRRQTAWTGLHDERGTLVDNARDSDFAWSAAFISYVMRLAGAGARFPYAPSHDTYIDAAVLGRSPVLVAHRVDSYAPVAGDLICTSRGREVVHFASLPKRSFASHCDFVVQASPGSLTVVGGNVDDAVTEKHVPVAPNGNLAGPDHRLVDTRYKWFVVLQVIYDR